MRHLTLVGAGVVFLLFAASSWAITVDGYYDDWTSPDTVNHDPNEAGVPDEYDIEYNWFEWEPSTGTMYFGMRQYSYISDTPNSNSYAAILLDVDQNPNTGGDPFGTGVSGVDYYMQASLPLASQVDPFFNTYGTFPNLYKWNGSGWDLVDDYTAWAARHANPQGGPYVADFIEWGLNASSVGSPSAFYWAGYIDNGVQAGEDNCPDDWQQPGYIPEPGTIGLLLLGLPLAAILRRKRT